MGRGHLRPSWGVPPSGLDFGVAQVPPKLQRRAGRPGSQALRRARGLPQPVSGDDREAAEPAGISVAPPGSRILGSAAADATGPATEAACEWWPGGACICFSSAAVTYGARTCRMGLLAFPHLPPQRTMGGPLRRPNGARSPPPI